MARSIRLSKVGREMAHHAFRLKGWTQEYLAGKVECSRTTVYKFFAGRPVAKQVFQAICNELNLEWIEIADFESEPLSSLSTSTAKENSTEDIQKPTGTAQVLTNEKTFAFAISGTVNPDDVPKLKAILALLQELSEDTSVKLIDIEPG